MKALSIAIGAALAMLPAQRSFAGAGSLDPSFGSGGVVILPNVFPASPYDAGNKVLIQGDGKILIVGQGGGDDSGIWRASFVAVRFNPDGSLDTSFGPEHDGYFIFPWGGGPAQARVQEVPARQPGFDERLPAGPIKPLNAFAFLLPKSDGEVDFAADQRPSGRWSGRVRTGHTTPGSGRR